MKYSFLRYLEAKRGVDDRSLNRMVLSEAQEILAENPTVLEIGSGSGTMLSRLLEWGFLSAGTRYLGVDIDERLVSAAQKHVLELRSRSIRLHEGKAYPPRDPNAITASFLQSDLFDLELDEVCDFLIANAFLDLVDLDQAIPKLLGLVADDGLLYFSLNFDGVTILEPSHPDDAFILERYHRSMDERVIDSRLSGDSRTGRKLFHRLAASGVEVLAVGSSDWIVTPELSAYPGDESYFLSHFLHFIQNTLEADRVVPQKLLSGWLAFRKEQILRNELVLIAHQLDYLGRKRLNN